MRSQLYPVHTGLLTGDDVLMILWQHHRRALETPQILGNGGPETLNEFLAIGGARGPGPQDASPARRQGRSLRAGLCGSVSGRCGPPATWRGGCRHGCLCGASAVTRIRRGALLREEGARQGQRAPSLGSSLRCFQQLLLVPLHRNGRRGEAESGWRRGAPVAGAVASGPPPPGGAELPWPPGRLLSWRWSCQS